MASLATITHSRPATRPMPVMIPAPGASPSYMPVRRQRGQLEERRRRVEQRVDPLARQQLAALDVPLPGCLGPARVAGPLQEQAELGRQGGVAPPRSRGIARMPGLPCCAVPGRPCRRSSCRELRQVKVDNHRQVSTVEHSRLHSIDGDGNTLARRARGGRVPPRH